jgi:hypothetical protein
MEILGTCDRLQLKWPDLGHNVNTRRCFEIEGHGDCVPKILLSFAAAACIPPISSTLSQCCPRHSRWPQDECNPSSDSSSECRSSWAAYKCRHIWLINHVFFHLLRWSFRLKLMHASTATHMRDLHLRSSHLCSGSVKLRFNTSGCLDWVALSMKVFMASCRGILQGRHHIHLRHSWPWPE